MVTFIEYISSYVTTSSPLPPQLIKICSASASHASSSSSNSSSFSLAFWSLHRRTWVRGEARGETVLDESGDDGSEFLGEPSRGEVLWLSHNIMVFDTGSCLFDHPEILSIFGIYVDFGIPFCEKFFSEGKPTEERKNKERRRRAIKGFYDVVFFRLLRVFDNQSRPS